MRKPKTLEPVRYVLHVFDPKTSKLVDTVFDTAKLRDAAWWKFTQRYPTRAAYRTQTRRTA